MLMACATALQILAVLDHLVHSDFCYWLQCCVLFLNCAHVPFAAALQILYTTESVNFIEAFLPFDLAIRSKNAISCV